jgi:hypothetical protein
VILYQAIGQLVPLIGGGIAYAFLRPKIGPLQSITADPAGEVVIESGVREEGA